MLDEVWRRRADWDVLHFHVQVVHFSRFRDIAARTITTLHSRLDQLPIQRVCQRFPEFPLVSISNAQRRPMPHVNWVGTVYHGVPPGLLMLADAPRRPYLAFLGRVSPEKRLDRAIEIARRADIPLKVACKVDSADRAYFESRIQPLVADSIVELVGEIGDTQKPAFLRNACALLFPIDWPEPFGLVMIEAMACGTPVIAFREGAVAEVVDEGVTGFIVGNVDEAVSAIARLPEIRRAGVRRRFEQRFCAERMACDYVNLYRKLASSPIELECAPAAPALLEPGSSQRWPS
jgi:glycosyltransferase involved in cell wall biosynthesis